MFSYFLSKKQRQGKPKPNCDNVLHHLHFDNVYSFFSFFMMFIFIFSLSLIFVFVVFIYFYFSPTKLIQFNWLTHSWSIQLFNEQLNEISLYFDQNKLHNFELGFSIIILINSFSCMCVCVIISVVYMFVWLLQNICLRMTKSVWHETC